MSSKAVDRLAGELDELAGRIATRVIAEVPGYAEDPVAQAILLPYARVNLDEVIRALRGIQTEPSTARQFALADAIVTGLSLEAVQRTFVVARDEIELRLRELAEDGEGLDEPLARFAEAFEMVSEAVVDEYVATKARLDPA